MTKTTWKTKEHIYKWLTRIGVHEGDIDIKTGSENKEKAIVKYKFKEQTYELATDKRKEYGQNLHNIECLIHSRVLGIERGIETVEQAFAGYQALPDYSNQSPYQVLGVPENSFLEACNIKFKELAKKYHPDVNNGDGTFFKKITKAIEDIERMKSI